MTPEGIPEEIGDTILFHNANGLTYMAAGDSGTVNCTVSVCPIDLSTYGYRPSLPFSATMIALYTIVLTIQIILGLRYKKWGFVATMVLGCLDEIIGYVGRILYYQNPWAGAGFIIQIGKSLSPPLATLTSPLSPLTLHLHLALLSKTPTKTIPLTPPPKVLITIGPVFFAAAIYVLLHQTILSVSPTASTARFNPIWYPRIFIPCDIISLVLQAAGGAMSATSNGQSQAGVDIALAGLIFQVITLTFFVVCVADYVVRSRGVWKRQKFAGRFVVFVGATAGATMLIFVRCCYRVYELSEGYSRDSEALRDEGMFNALEGG
jgi:hypothetical protein